MVSIEDFSAGIKRTKNPGVTVSHLLFKTAALFFYLFGGMFSDDYIVVCVICILCLAFDFWTVKNITGRLMVGLRWSNHINEDGTSEWRYESLPDLSAIRSIDRQFFWGALYVTPLIWTVLFFVDLLKLNFEWLIIVGVALCLNGAQVHGYIKCSREASAKVEQMTSHLSLATNVLQSQMYGQGLSPRAESAV
jgi:hypothetical protein